MTDVPFKRIADAVKNAGEIDGINSSDDPTGQPSRWHAGGAKSGRQGKARERATTAQAEPQSDTEKGVSARHRPPQRDSLMGLTTTCDLWHGEDGEAFCTFPVSGHRESWAVRSPVFKRWLAARAYDEMNLVPGSQAVEDTLRVLEARAANEGAEQSPWRRVGYRDGKLYLDLCDPTWRAVEITSHGWRVLAKPDLPFIRSQSMRPLPEPQGGYLIDDLRRFINVASEEDFVLVVAWLVAALRDRGPYPILVINGEQGSGKSTFSRLIRSLIDPNAAPIRAAPRDDRDLIVAASNSHVIAMDNLSKIDAWLADGLCRLATGGGFSTRMLHTDKEEMVFQATRPIILNGIPLLTERADLADRAVTVRLKAIPEDDRQPEDELWQEWKDSAPRVLGALCDALSAGLRNVGHTRLKRMPRLADFAKWVSAAETGLGWEPGTFMAAYGGNRRDVADSAFEADAVAVAIRDFINIKHQPGWCGTATEWLFALYEMVSESVKKSRSWPATAQGLGNRIDRVAPLLRGKGLHVERRHSGTRTIHIAPIKH